MHDPLLFRPASTYRVQRSTWTDTPIPPDEPVAANPPAGAVIEYFLPHDSRHPVTLEVFDGGGDLVRRFRSDDPPEPDAQQLSRELIPAYWLAPPRVLPARGGMHRWVWDLRYAPPLTVTHGYPISAVPYATPRLPLGPMALPGSYRVRLTVDGHRFEEPLTVKPDPRVRAGADLLAEQLRLATELAGLLTESSRALLAAQSEQAQVKALAPAGSAADALQAFQARLTALLDAGHKEDAGAAPRTLLPDVQRDLDALYTEVTRGDAAPTAAQHSATESSQRTLANLLTDWRQLQADLPELNKRLHAAGLAAVRADLAPPRDANEADLD
jgi:hypothetical protein